MIKNVSKNFEIILFFTQETNLPVHYNIISKIVINVVIVQNTDLADTAAGFRYKTGCNKYDLG